MWNHICVMDLSVTPAINVKLGVITAVRLSNMDHSLNALTAHYDTTHTNGATEDSFCLKELANQSSCWANTSQKLTSLSLNWVLVKTVLLMKNRKEDNDGQRNWCGSGSNYRMVKSELTSKKKTKQHNRNNTKPNKKRLDAYTHCLFNYYPVAVFSGDITMNCDGRVGYFTRKIEKSEEVKVSDVKVRKRWSPSVFQKFFLFLCFKKCST